MNSMSAPIAAFFDLDKTLISKSSAFAFGVPFLRRGVISPMEVAWLARQQMVFKRRGASDVDIDRQRAAFSRGLAGMDAALVDRIVRESIPKVITPYIFPEGQEEVAWHKAQGHDVILISTSGEPTVQPIGELLGFPTVRAAHVEVKEGVFTGVIDVEAAGVVKLRRAMELVEERGYIMKDAYFYTDSISDLPLLEAVGHPVAVNPDRELAQIARDRGWPVRHFSLPKRH